MQEFDGKFGKLLYLETKLLYIAYYNFYLFIFFLFDGKVRDFLRDFAGIWEISGIFGYFSELTGIGRDV